jgi:hypothetical protein
MKALLEAGSFNVTAVVRPGSNHQFPAGVAVREVDFASFDSIKAGLQGQDAAVNATSIQDPSAHTRFIDAAAAADVCRLIPADFGMDPATALGPEFPVFAVKAATLARLRELTTADGGSGSGIRGNRRLTWTVVSNGPFLDWNMATGFLGINIKNKRAQIMAGGTNAGPHTTLPAIGRAVAGVLLHPAETANRNVCIQSVNKSQNELLALAREALGAEGWQITHEDSRERYEWAMAEIEKGNYEDAVWMYQIRYMVANAKLTAPWRHVDNNLLGVKEMSDQEVVEMIRRLVAENKTTLL